MVCRPHIASLASITCAREKPSLLSKSKSKISKTNKKLGVPAPLKSAKAKGAYPALDAGRRQRRALL